MFNLLEQAICTDDGERAAKVIQQTLGIESDDVARTASRRTVRLIASSAPVSSMSGCRPKRAFQPTQRDSRPTAEPEAARLTPAKRALYSSRDERVRCPVILGCPGHLNVERDSHGRV
jgi:hypothetical protein